VATLTIAATEHPETSPPSVRLDITASGTPTVTSATVTRTDVNGRTYPVRTSDGGALPVSGGVATLWDYEIPYGTTSTYSVSATGATTVTDTALLNVTVPWLVHPGVPALSVPVTVQSAPDLTRPAEQGMFRVIGRRDPVVVSGGARSLPSGTLGLLTRTAAERAALDLLLDEASPLLLNTPDSWELGPAYISVGDVAETRVSRIPSEPYRVWRLDFQVVGRPAGGSQALRTWETVAAEYATWSAIPAGTTWAQLANPVT
jgi:hypothetical protein